MIKKHIALILIVVIVIISITSCNNIRNDEKVRKNDTAIKDTIQLWTYEVNRNNIDAYIYMIAVKVVAAKIVVYCDLMDIPLEVKRYYERQISYDDYVQKRNVAMAAGNVIVLEDARRMSDIAKHHADYTKIENYNTLLDIYKNQFCIPIGIGYVATRMNDDIFKYYDINLDNRIITYDEYLSYKQQMKEKGAKFNLCDSEWKELSDYFLIKNDLYSVDDNSEVLKDRKLFKDSINKTIQGIYDNFNQYYNDFNSVELLDKKGIDSTVRAMYDENSQINISKNIQTNYVNDYYFYLFPTNSILDKVFVIMPEKTILSPCLYIYKKVTNEKIYDIVNYVMEGSTYNNLILYPKESIQDHGDDAFYSPTGADADDSPYYSPTQNKDNIRRYCELDSSWRYNGMFSRDPFTRYQNYIDFVKLLNDEYEVILNSGEKSAKNASYYFSNVSFCKAIKEFINETVVELIKEGKDYNNPNVKIQLDKKINKFILDFYVHFNI